VSPYETAETPSTDQTENGRNHRRYRYQKVLDARKQPIRGLWKRNGNFIARITVEAPDGKRLIRWKPLEEANTPAEAQAALRKVLTDREQGKPIQTKRPPKLSEGIQRYLGHVKTLSQGKGKRESTIDKEEASLDLCLSRSAMFALIASANPSLTSSLKNGLVTGGARAQLTLT